MKKKVLSILLVLVFVLGFTACGVEIADNNGPDDYSLATITDENIINLDLGASSYSMSPGSEDDDYMTTMTKFKGSEFSGVAELYGINLLGKSDIEFDMGTIQVKEGNFRLMVVHDGEIVHDFDLEEMSQTFKLEDVNGYVSLVMAGETADFKFYIQVW